jgi:hypothetical protein
LRRAILRSFSPAFGRDRLIAVKGEKGETGMSSESMDRISRTPTHQGVTDYGVHYVLAISLGVSAMAMLTLFVLFAF